MQGGNVPGGPPGGSAPPPWAWLLEGADSDELEGPGSGPGSDLLVSILIVLLKFLRSCMVTNVLFIKHGKLCISTLCVCCFSRTHVAAEREVWLCCVYMHVLRSTWYTWCSLAYAGVACLL
jgi:hypothetical protein